MSEPTKKEFTASRHPAKGRPASKPTRSQQKPVEGEDGFSGHIFRQRLKIWEERDRPDVENRKSKA